MRNIRSRRRAQRNWDKLRKYVMYTWGPSNLDGNNTSSRRYTLQGIGSIRNKRKSSRNTPTLLDKNIGIPDETNVVPMAVLTERVKSSLAGSMVNSDGTISDSRGEKELKSGRTIGIGRLQDGLYVLDNNCGLLNPCRNEALLGHPISAEQEIIQWHRRLGHLSFSALERKCLMSELKDKIKDQMICAWEAPHSLNKLLQQ
ncbi:hypothetical protein COCNU_scaffold001272G000010 [Cocos nucifera]|nr:hypothetical protein [Cocos nucifera]